MSLFKHKHIVCDCGSLEHQIVFSWFPDDDEYHETFVNVYLSSRSFWRRLTAGLRYIFGYKCVFGHWEETTLSPEQCAELAAFLAERAKA